MKREAPQTRHSRAGIPGVHAGEHVNFPEPVIQAFRTAPERVAVETSGRAVTRGELLAMIGTVAGGLRGSGLGPGSGVAMVLDVSPESLAAYLAAYTVGCRVIGVRPGYSEAQQRHVLSNGVDAVLDDHAVADLLRGPQQPVAIEARPDDVARVSYTSGSTGRQKGCAQTYRAMSAHWSWAVETWAPTTAELAACTDRFLLFGTLASPVVLDYLALCLLAVIPEPDESPLFPG